MHQLVVPSKEEILRYVMESNLFEGIKVPKNHRLVTDHIDAVRFVIDQVQYHSRLPQPLEIHEILMASQPESMPGEYRMTEIDIGPNHTPPSGLVPSLMETLIDSVENGPSSLTQNVEQWIWDTHLEYQCIHPQVDGNGRCGRIWKNGKRLQCGLAWLTLLARDKGDYFHRINTFRWRSLTYREYARGDPPTNVETEMFEDEDPEGR